MGKVIVVGGGPAGMFAAAVSASNGNEVTLIEKNKKLGKKLSITGKGRCNITNAGDIEDLFNNIITNRKFMYSSIYTFNNYDLINFFEEKGLETKVERGNRVFPVSDKALDVIQVLKKNMKDYGVKVITNCKVVNILREEKVIKGVQTENEFLNCDKVIIATGGVSYPGTGSTGDGYIFAEKTGHKIIKPKASLVPLIVKEAWVKELQGLSLKNVSINVYDKNKNKKYTDFGEMLFTHYGVSGPMILSGSSCIDFKKDSELVLEIDLKPAIDENTLDKRLLKDFSKNINKDFRNSLNELLPRKLIPICIKLSNIDPFKKTNEITKEERKNLVKILKHFKFTLIDKRSINEAIITSGGIDVKNINPHTMESKLIEGLYFIGEVLDVDALTGGYKHPINQISRHPAFPHK